MDTIGRFPRNWPSERVTGIDVLSQVCYLVQWIWQNRLGFVVLYLFARQIDRTILELSLPSNIEHTEHTFFIHYYNSTPSNLLPFV